MRSSHRAGLPDDVWDERQRWLRAILWAHVVALAALAAARTQCAGALLPYAAAIAAPAALAHVRALPRRLRATAVALGLLGGSLGFVELSDGATAAWAHPFLVLALLALYEDTALVLLAVGAVAAAQLVAALAGEPGAAYTAVVALVGAVAIAAARVNACLRDEAREAIDRFRSSFDSAPIGMAIVTLDHAFLDVNSALCEIVGHPRETVLRLGLRALTAEEDRGTDAHLVRQLLEGSRRSFQRQQRFVHADGHLVWVNVSLSFVPGTGASPDYFIAQVEDVTERQRTLEQLQHLADHDSLTGLLNRRRLEHELAQQLALAERYGHRACLILLDLDDFKSTNDTFGHGVGDELLKDVADVLRNRVRRSDFVARLGGDEFAILLARASREQARRVAEGVARAIRERVYVTGGQELRTTASFGIAAIEPGDAPRRVLVRADQALYEVKQSGRDGVRVAAPRLPPPRGAPAG